jgi:hypothetical protein
VLVELVPQFGKALLSLPPALLQRFELQHFSRHRLLEISYLRVYCDVPAQLFPVPMLVWISERANNLVRKPLPNVLLSARFTGGWRAPEPDFNLRSADAALMWAFGVVVCTTVEKL